MRLGEWWDAVPGAQSAYNFVAEKWADWTTAGRQLPVLQDTATAVARYGDPTQRAVAVQLGADVTELRRTWTDWNPRLTEALGTIRRALGLGAVPVLMLTLIVAGAAIVGAFLFKKSSAERALMSLVDSLSPEAKLAVAKELASKTSGSSFGEEFGKYAGLAVLVVGGVWAWSQYGKGRA